MTALSKPSLRSSSRKYAGFDEREANTHFPFKLRGKRTRDSSPSCQSDSSSKRHKSQNPDTIPRARIKGQNGKALPIRDRPVPKKAATAAEKVRKPDLGKLQVNGTTTTPTTNATTLHDHAIGKGTNNNVDTAETLRKVDTRSLRSHDGGSRSKSELSLYFPNYDELVSIEPKEPQFITPETILHIIDDLPKSTKPGRPPSKLQLSSTSQPNGHRNPSKIIKWPPETFTTVTSATRISLPSPSDPAHQPTNDALPDSLYLKAHRRAERQEKQLRNIEKERAMHEKVQLERLLDGLNGHDWLRVMGISGITDGEKKAFEPKRDYFIHEVRSLLEKFRLWREEEKRRKVEKEETVDDEDKSREATEAVNETAPPTARAATSPRSDGDPPDYSAIDASAARQLHHEAILATKKPSQNNLSIKNRSQASKEKPFTSFYSKPYMREAAIGKHRRGRARTAFGRPVPDPEERDFKLPQDVLTEEAIAASERGRRAAKRRKEEDEGGI